MMSELPSVSDLASFWSNAGISQSVSRYTLVNPGWTQAGSTSALEATGDVEWAGAMAPGAQIRLYATVDPAQFSSQILDDLTSNPGLHQATISDGGAEIWYPSDILLAQSQDFAALAAEGITVFASAGDGGSIRRKPPAPTIRRSRRRSSIRPPTRTSPASAGP